MLTSIGAHVTIFARKQVLLDQACEEIISSRQSDSQIISAVAADMGDAQSARTAITTQPRLPDILYCVAGGTPNELGYLIDLEPETFERCMTNNYYSSLFPAQTVLKLWTQDDEDAKASTMPRLRKIIFVNSSASLVPVPGYLAYSAGKAAQRALADTLRLEAMRYSGPVSEYQVQCVFAHNYITPTFLEEQKNKPDLTKRIEGTTGGLKELEKQFPYAHKIAPEIVQAAEKGDFAVMDKRLDPQVIWANCIGTEPKRGWGIVDSLLAVLMGIFVFPFIRRDMEKLCKGDALRKG